MNLNTGEEITRYGKITEISVTDVITKMFNAWLHVKTWKELRSKTVKNISFTSPIVLWGYNTKKIMLAQAT